MANNSSEDVPAPAQYVLSPRQIASWGLPGLRPKCPGYPIAGIPSLQRGLVWKPAQTELLWDSLLRGFPIGAFVLCQKLQEQRTRDEAARDLSNAKYHLLDGQQRAHAIGLGFENPFEDSPRKPHPILWLDLNPNLKGTRAFLCRVTTEAHPWGYAADDTANRVGIARVKESFRACGYVIDENKPTRRPWPQECWPIEAKIPVPFSWLTMCENGDAASFWEAIKAKCGELAVGTHDAHWARKAMQFLSAASSVGSKYLSVIQQGMRRASAAQIVCLKVPEDALTARSAQETEASDQQKGKENISNVEHLFHRLNAGGVRLEGDELTYSMIKAYWPDVEEPIKAIAARRMPEARLFALAARVALAATRESISSWTDQRIPGPISVSDIRHLAYDKSRGEQRKQVHDFFVMENEVGLAAVVGIIEDWLGPKGGDEYDIGLPPVLKTSIARTSPEVYLLLMWLARRVLRDRDHDQNSGGQGEALRKRIVGLATALHWFGEDKRRAAQAIADNLVGKPVEPASFQNILGTAYEVDRRVGLYRPLPPHQLEELIVCPDERTLEAWRWYKLVEKGDETATTRTWPFLHRVKEGRELLLYAQRAYIKRRFDYDPARADMWEQHDRPWDFDHILPSAMTYYQAVPNKEALNEWVYCIANLRACPMEANRSDQKDAPKTKLSNPRLLADSFVDEGGEIEGFERGCKGVSQTTEVLAFVQAAKSRLMRVYRQWYDTLEIGVLTGDTQQMGAC